MTTALQAKRAARSGGNGPGVAGDAVATQMSRLQKKRLQMAGLDIPEEEKQGVLDKIKGVVETPGRTLLRGLGALRYTTAAVASTVNELTDFIPGESPGQKQAVEGTTERASFGDWWKQLKSGEGFGSYLDTGNKWTDRSLGLTLDIIGDPLTYVGGAGILAKSGKAGASAALIQRGVPKLVAKGVAKETAKAQLDEIGAVLAKFGPRKLTKEQHKLAEEALGEKIGGAFLNVPGSGIARQLGKLPTGSGQVRILPYQVTGAVAGLPGLSHLGQVGNKIADAAAQTKVAGETGPARKLVRSGNVKHFAAGLAEIEGRAASHGWTRRWAQEVMNEMPDWDWKAPDLAGPYERLLSHAQLLNEEVLARARKAGIPEPERFSIDPEDLLSQTQARVEKAIADGQNPQQVLSGAVARAGYQAQDMMTRAHLVGQGITVQGQTKAQKTATKEAARAAKDETIEGARVARNAEVGRLGTEAQDIISEGRRRVARSTEEVSELNRAVKEAEKWAKAGKDRVGRRQWNVMQQEVKNSASVRDLAEKTKRRLGGIYDELTTLAETARAQVRDNHTQLNASSAKAHDRLGAIDVELGELEAKGARTAGEVAERVTKAEEKAKGALDKTKAEIERLKKTRPDTRKAKDKAAAKAKRAEIDAKIREAMARAEHQRRIIQGAGTARRTKVGPPGTARLRAKIDALQAEKAELEDALAVAQRYAAMAPKTLDNVWELGMASTRTARARLQAERDELVQVERALEQMAAADPEALQRILGAFHPPRDAAKLRARADDLERAAFRIKDVQPEQAMEMVQQARVLRTQAETAVRVPGTGTVEEMADAAKQLSAMKRDFNMIDGLDVSDVDTALAGLKQQATEAEARLAKLKGEQVTAEQMVRALRGEAQAGAREAAAETTDAARKAAADAAQLRRDTESIFRETARKFGVDGEYIDDEEIAKALEKLNGVKTYDDFGNFYDKMMGHWKSWAIMSPGFHGRNFMGAVFNNWLADVPLSAYYAWRKAQRQFDKAPEKMDPVVRAIIAAIRSHGTNTQNQMNVDLGEMGWSVLKKFDRTKKFAQPISRGTRRAASKVESAARGALAYHTMATRMAAGDTPEAALLQAHFMVAKLHFDYDDLTQFEKKVLKRAMPFYTWNRKNLPLQLEMMLRQPRKYAMWGKVRENMTLGNEDAEIVPDYYTDLLGGKTPLNIGGADVIPTSPGLPYANVFQQITDPTEVASMLTPFATVPLERWAGKQLFSDLPLRDDLEKPTGAMAAVAKGLALPGIQHIAKAAGLNVVEDAEGNPMMSDKDTKTLGAIVPIVGRLGALFPGGDEGTFGGAKSRSKQVSFLTGLGFKALDDNAIAGELYRRNTEVEDAVERLVERGIIPEAQVKAWRKKKPTKTKSRQVRRKRPTRAKRPTRRAS